MDCISRSRKDKEETMKRLIYLTVVLMIGFICFGCSGMSAEQRQAGGSDLRSSVGKDPFVGGTSREAYSLVDYQMRGF